MNTPRNFPPDPSSQIPAPGEIQRPGPAYAWAIVGGLALAGVAGALAWSPKLEGVRTELRAVFSPAKPVAPPAPVAKPPARAPVAKTAPAQPGAAVPAPAAPSDDRARPVSFYYALWGVNEAQSPIGWTSRVEVRPGAAGGTVAKLWITCPKGSCEAGEVPVTPVAHLQKKEMTAFLSMQRHDGDRVWTLLLRPAPGRPDELERWEWYGPPGSETRTQSVLGHVRRMRPDGTFH